MRRGRCWQANLSICLPALLAVQMPRAWLPLWELMPGPSLDLMPCVGWEVRAGSMP